MNAVIKIYEKLKGRDSLLWGGLCLICSILIYFAISVNYNEDIFNFLPSDTEYTESMKVYSSLSEASRIVFIIDGDNPDSICNAIDLIGEALPDAITEVDMDGFLSKLDYACKNMPYFLNDSDYIVLEACFDSVSGKKFIKEKLLETKKVFATPGSSFLIPWLSSDPLRLISPSEVSNRQYSGTASAFSSYNGYMMTADKKTGFAFYDSPYGSTESKNNGILTNSLSTICNNVQAQMSSVSVRLLGAPVIAAENAKRIKSDTLIAIGLSFTLILLLLLSVCSHKKDILLILLSISFGWLCGMAALAVFDIEASVIVLGMGSIILGISANYPLHLLIHKQYTMSVKQNLSEVVKPLFIGNITTIAAFMVLLTIDSTALQQLGLFAVADLLGTIIFCVIWLPHLIKINTEPVKQNYTSTHGSDNLWYKISVSLVSVLLVGSAITLIFNDKPLFDTNISHINYMTERQRADFAWIESIAASSDKPAYLASSAKTELNARVERWNEFWTTHNADSLICSIKKEADACRIRDNVFQPFYNSVSKEFTPLDLSDTQTLADLWPGRFDTESMNSYIANELNDNFEYIGVFCAAIVLIFLCISFKSIILGLIAFIPMVLCWLIIFASMSIFDIQFNIVNIILATFIFGQGDDYSVFIVEGLDYERRTGQKMLPQYKKEIIVSALIMLIGIGVLVTAKHPAIFSLGIVTLIGMVSVVIMSFCVPPILYRIYMRQSKRPVEK